MALCYTLISPTIYAAEKPDKVTAQTTLGLYVTAQEAWELLNKDPDALLVDVRDPIEIKFTGFASGTDIHVPWMVSDPQQWDEKRSSWAMKKNPHFESQMISALDSKKANPETAIFVMCRSGSTRSAPAVNLLAEKGYTRVWTIVDGFEGGKLQSGNSKGVRAKDGWRNSGLPWGYKVDADIAWKNSF
ncbi:sulfurtransferase [Neptunomonas concharum]|uniref:Sulfurtransferase n=2 Tax=Neptunomonas concharum TaxID=1031538 RepID=A0A5P1RF86_9GAMM|nr:sulfurtransferase [Neptunomonas concharum]